MCLLGYIKGCLFVLTTLSGLLVSYITFWFKTYSIIKVVFFFFFSIFMERFSGSDGDFNNISSTTLAMTVIVMSRSIKGLWPYTSQVPCIINSLPCSSLLFWNTSWIPNLRFYYWISMCSSGSKILTGSLYGWKIWEARNAAYRSFP